MKTISQRPLLIGLLRARASARAERRLLWTGRLDKWSRIAFRFAILAVIGFSTGAAIALLRIFLRP